MHKIAVCPNVPYTFNIILLMILLIKDRTGAKLVNRAICPCV